MPLYEIATLTIAVGTLAKALPRIQAYMAQGPAQGTLRACWHCDLGPLNEIMVVRDFADDGVRLAERDRLATAGNAFGIGEFTTAMRAETFRLFPWLPPIAAGSPGPYYEVREYTVRSAGMIDRLRQWEEALPQRLQRSPLVAAMYAVEGIMPRYVHIWPYASLDARAEIRARAIADGIWPPKGGIDSLLTMRNGIYVPAPFSPLR